MASNLLTLPIEKRPGVCGGRACIRGHRIAVWILVSLRRLGADDDNILRGYPDLTPEDLAAAWAYAEANPEEIDRDLRQNEEDPAGEE